MSKETIDLLVTATMTTINTNMAALSDSPTVEQVERIFNDAIERAYSQCGDAEDKKYLKKKLNLKFHPDKFSNNSELFVTRLINDETLKNIPAHVHKQVIDNPTESDTLKLDPMAAVTAIIAEFNVRFAVEQQQYNRYFTPIAMTVSLIQGVIDIVNAVIQLSTVVVVISAHFVIPYLEGLLLNLITSNQYEIEIEKTVQRKPLTELAEKWLQSQGVNTDSIENHEEMMRIFYEVKLANGQDHAQANAFLTMSQELNFSFEKLNVAGLTRFKAITDAFLHHITRDLPLDNVDKAISILHRALLGVLLATFLVIDAGVQLSRIASIAALLIVLATTLFLKVAATLLLNSPLYLLDGLTYLANVVSQMVDKVNAHFTANAEPVPASTPAPAAAAAEVRPDSDLSGSAAADMEAGCAMNDNISETDGVTPGQERAVTTEALSSLLQNSLFASGPDASNADAFHSVSSRASSPVFGDID